MHHRRFTTTIALLLALCPSVAPTADAGQNTGTHAEHQMQEHGFGVNAFDRFHDLLHPLQHEALPAGDFKTVRAQAPALIAAGRKVVRLRPPANTAQLSHYRQSSKHFAAALDQFRRAATSGADDAQLRRTFSAVHDRFEELAELLPRP